MKLPAQQVPDVLEVSSSLSDLPKCTCLRTLRPIFLISLQWGADSFGASRIAENPQPLDPPQFWGTAGNRELYGKRTGGGNGF